MDDHTAGVRNPFDPYIPVWILVVSFTFYLLTLHPDIGWGAGADVARQSLFPETMEHLRHPLRTFMGLIAASLSSSLPFLSGVVSQNAVSAFFSAATLSLLYLVCLRSGWSRFSGIMTCVTLGLSQMFWHLATTSGPHPVMMFLLLLVVYCTMRWTARNTQHGTGWLVAAAVLIGVGTGESIFFFLLFPGMIILLFSFSEPYSRWWSPFLFVLFLLVGYGTSLVLSTLLTGNLHPDQLLPVQPERLSEHLSPDDLFSNMTTYGLLLMYQFPLFGVLLGLFGVVVQFGKQRPVRWILLVSILLSIPLFDTSFPDGRYFLSSLAFVLFAVLIGEGLGWFLRYASLHREAMDSSYGSILIAVVAVLSLSPIMLYISVADPEHRTIVSSLLPERSYPRIDRTTYYMVPWQGHGNGARRFWLDTKSIPDHSILIADRGAAAPVRFYSLQTGAPDRIDIRNPDKVPFRRQPVHTVNSWLNQYSTHDGEQNEPPARGVYSLNSHPLFQKYLLQKEFQFDQPLVTPIDGVNGSNDPGEPSQRRLARVERVPIWRIRRFSDK